MRPFYPVQQASIALVAGEIYSVSSCYLKAYLRYRCRDGAFRQSEVRVDTGAPFSVIPYDIWFKHNLEIRWRSSELHTDGGDRPGTDISDQLQWLGIPCELGELAVALIDERRQVSRGLSLIAKLPQRSASRDREKVFLLGQDFFVRNDLSLLLQPGRTFPVQWWDGDHAERKVVGWIEVPWAKGNASHTSLKDDCFLHPPAPNAPRP